MYTILTKEFLKLFPNWKKFGWKVGDLMNIMDILKSMGEKEIEYLDLHPPKRPQGLK